MPFDFHSDSAYYLEFLAKNARESIMPFITPHIKNWEGKQILELGCGEGGNLVPFLEAGALCTGIDLNKVKIEEGKTIMEKWVKKGYLNLFYDDIFNPAIGEQFNNRFDLIILKDVIEHIPNKEKALMRMRSFLKDDGLLFIGWPPWNMPFGGHQQIAQSKWLKTTPWIHLLPKKAYGALLRTFKEPKEVYDELLEIHDFRVSINQLDELVKSSGFKKVDSKHYFINPIYQYKFGLKTRKQANWITKTPYLRDFLTTSSYYLLGKSN